MATVPGRHSLLTQLNPSNVGDLRIAWIFSTGGETDAQRTPLYHDGVVYQAQDNTVFAVDARSGGRLWKYVHELPDDWGGQFADSSPASIATWLSTGSTGWNTAT